MKATIIVPTYNHSDLTIECIDSVIKHTPTDVSIIIFDDHSDEKQLDYLVKNIPKDKSYRKIDILRSSSNNGFAKACNEAAQYVERLSSIIIFLNNDTIVTEKWYRPLVDNLKDDIGICGSKLLYPKNKFSNIHQREIKKNTIQHAGIAVSESKLPFHLFQFENSDLHETNITKTFPYVTGASFSIQKELFQDLGGFNAKYTNGCEDLDLCIRVRNSGKSVLYCANSVAFRHETATRNPETSRQNLTLFQEEYMKQLERDTSFVSKEIQ